jgi:hypothetical protein
MFTQYFVLSIDLGDDGFGARERARQLTSWYRPMKARHFEDEGDLEDKRRILGDQRGGDDDVNVRGNVRR